MQVYHYACHSLALSSFTSCLGFEIRDSEIDYRHRTVSHRHSEFTAKSVDILRWGGSVQQRDEVVHSAQLGNRKLYVVYPYQESHATHHVIPNGVDRSYIYSSIHRESDSPICFRGIQTHRSK